ncbi:unnamed protein product [Paramecium primaurelia]|uniref:Uncharacterized protein n=1 Tax=Paramecium primaurelia TaxID=5886 RepID=A0A8S1PK38_PARPR|nr:unnamed protein product [Paramecium primaurelia]
MLDNSEAIIKESLESYLNYRHAECVLKTEMSKPHLRQKYCECLQLESFVEFVLTCLELVNTTVLMKQNYQLSHKLHLQYWKIFNELPQPKDEMVSFILIAVWFLIHSTIFKQQTQEERNKIDQRFLFNSYHVLLYYINGFYVSDEFVQQQVDIYLNNRYLDYRLNSFQKKNLKKQQMQQTQTNLFPNVSIPELTQVQGATQFQKELRFRKKQKKQQSEPIIMEQQQQQLNKMENGSDRGGRFPNSIKFNLNQLSPSINSLLNLSNKATPRAKLVTHQIISHNFNQVKVSNVLKNLDEPRTTLTQMKESRDNGKGQRLLDKYRVTQPPLEYFKKHPKVDHLFRDMLEMKLVLQQSHQHIYTQPRLVKEDSTALREKLAQYLEERTLKQNLTPQDDLLQSSPQFGSNMMITYQHIRTPSDGTRMQETHSVFPSGQISSFLQTQISQSPQPKSNNNKFVYEDKRKQYTDRFNKANGNQTTDDKISNLQHNLLVKQHMIQQHLKKQH